MATIMQTYLIMVTVVVRVISNSEPGNLPVNGCSTQEIDFLFLYHDSNDPEERWQQELYATNFANDVKDPNQTSQRLLFGSVYDLLSFNNTEVNVSSWRFNTSLAYTSLKNVLPLVKNKYYNHVNKTIELKVQFVKRLFSEMAGVRENVTHIAVIFIDGFSLSFEETRSIPHIVQQHVTDIKIFVVVLDVRYVGRIVHLRDTLLRGIALYSISRHTLVMAICNQCLKGWISLERSDHTYSVSCYFLPSSVANRTGAIAASECSRSDSSLAAIGNKEELNLLQKHLSALLKNRHIRFDSDKTSTASARIYIGLRKSVEHFGEGFYWEHFSFSLNLPLVVTHWLPRKPSGWFSTACVMWRFVWNVTKNNVANLASSDGWEDVHCEDEYMALGLCEVTLPRRVEDNSMIIVKPASNKSLSQALTKGDLMIYRENIVSVSANIASRDFVEFLKQIEHELFPFFDCGVGIPDPRYISYIYVCDSVDHCSNRRDEMRCSHKSQSTNTKNNIAMKCPGVYCCDDSCLPIQQVGDGEVDCIVCGNSTVIEVNDESEALVRSSKRNENCALFCNVNNTCVHFSQLNDSHTDCTGPEGPLDETIGKLETSDTCYNIIGPSYLGPQVCLYQG